MVNYVETVEDLNVLFITKSNNPFFLCIIKKNKIYWKIFTSVHWFETSYYHHNYDYYNWEIIMFCNQFNFCE